MTEQEVRELVRAAIARQRGAAASPAATAEPRLPLVHVSHHRFALPTGDGPCLIEPGVACTHCGFCQSLRTLMNAKCKMAKCRKQKVGRQKESRI
jgi:hypothetical protein